MARRMAVGARELLKRTVGVAARIELLPEIRPECAKMIEVHAVVPAAAVPADKETTPQGREYKE